MIWIVPAKLIVIVAVAMVIAWVLGILLSSLMDDRHHRDDKPAHR